MSSPDGRFDAATRADVVLLLPKRPDTAWVAPTARSWAASLEGAGIRPASRVDADVVFDTTDEDSGDERQPVIVDRFVRSRATRLVAQRFLPVPNLDTPALFVPIDQPQATRYAMRWLSVPAERSKIIRNGILARVLPLGLPVPGAISVLAATPSAPYIVRAAEELGVPPGSPSILALGRATERAAFHVFPNGESSPAWILKFRRDPQAPMSGASDAAGVELALSFGASVADKVPRFVGNGDAAGHRFAVETAAPGAQLVYALRRPGSRSARLAIVSRVVDWLVGVAAVSTRSDGVDRERRNPTGVPAGLSAAFAEVMATVPGVLEHGDLGPEHVIVDDSRFSIIDWEGASAQGLPLFDLAFFLAQTLPIVDGELDSGAHTDEELVARLFRGESASSPFLFRALRSACLASNVDPRFAGTLLAAGWLRIATPERGHFARVWFSDPALGPDWPVWRAALDG